jgi:hypothetical protein
MSSTFGQRLENLLDVSGVPASELGTLAGMSHAIVGVLISKDRKKREEDGAPLRPAATTVVGLARVLGTTVEYLLDGKGKSPTKKQVAAAVAAARATRDAETVRANGTEGG